MSSTPYTVEYIQSGTIDITEYVLSVKMTNQGTGRVRSATMMLDSSEGKFITNANSGATPIINDFDKFKITFTDNNGNVKKGIFEEDQNLKQLDETAKYVLPLELLGRERDLQQIKTTAYYEFFDPYFVINDLINRYNVQKGTNQAVVSTIGDLGQELNHAPKNITNIYDFTGGVTYYDAIMSVIARLTQESGLSGAGTAFSLLFEDSELFDFIINMTVQEQGTTTGSIPVIQSSESDPFHSVTCQKNIPNGTQVFARGMTNTGTEPPDLQIYQSLIEQINNYPPYNSSFTYSAGIRVNVNGTIYEALGFVNTGQAPPNPTYWVARSVQDVIDGYIAIGKPAYDPTAFYVEGIIVSYTTGLNTRAYISTISVPTGNPPPTYPTTSNAHWTQLTINYSLWTKQKEIVTKNTCSNADQPFGGTTGNFDGPAFPDGNLVIRDRIDPSTGEYKFYRDFVWFRAISDVDIKNDARMSQYLMGPNHDTFYNGMTVCVDTSLGTPSGVFAGTDIFGRFFADSIAQYDGTNWIVTRTPQVGDQCAVWLEGKNYEYNVTVLNANNYGNAHSTPGFSPKYRGPFGTTHWRDISATAGGNDCWHYPSNIEKVDGLLIKVNNGFDYSSYVSESALKITYTANPLGTGIAIIESFFSQLYQGAIKFAQGLLNGQIVNQYTFSVDQILKTQAEDYYNFGWWYALPFPYPFNTLNGIGESVGEFYGGGKDTASTFACLDIQNSNFSHSGLTGYNHNEVSDMGSPFTGLQFIFQFDILINGTRQPFQGNLPFTMTVYDDLRQVWRADFTIPFLGVPQPVFVPFSQFTVDRPSRTPMQLDSLADIIDFVAVPEIEIRSIFEQRRVRLITIQFSQSYDEYLRYVPASIFKLLNTIVNDFVPFQFVGIIDALTLTKQPFVSSGVVFDRVINPDIVDVPNIRNYIQLQSIAQAEADLATLSFEQYTVVRDGSCDLSTEQSVYLHDSSLINEGDDPFLANTRKLILMSDELSYDNQNGFLRTMTLTKRKGGP